MGEVVSGEHDSIWLRPQRGTRGPTPEYTRDRIAAAAIALADDRGLVAVTMRAVAVALGTGPASLYRYVATRDELIELMVDAAHSELTDTRTEFDDGSASGTGTAWLDALLGLARESRDTYMRHPWLVDTAGMNIPLGPHAVGYLERAVSALADLDVSARTKLEAIGVLSGLVPLLARAEITQRQAGSSLPQWQRAQAAYLGRVVADGLHPHLAAALVAGAAESVGAEASGEAGGDDGTFDRIVTRVVTGLFEQ